MKQSYAAQTLLLSLAALALSACSDQRQDPAPETAVPDEVRSLADAKTRFQTMIDWQSRSGAHATLYDDLLHTNDALGEMGDDGAVHHSGEYEWFAFIDYEPGAYFRHPTGFAFLTYAEPKVSIVAGNHLPTLNKQPIWPSVRAMLSDPNTLRATSWLSRPPQRRADDIVAYAAETWPPRMAQDACKNERRAYALLVHNLDRVEKSQETLENLELMAHALRANGYYVPDFTVDAASSDRRPFINLAAPNGHGLYQLMNVVNVHVDFNDCCEELIVYLTGETRKEKVDYRTETTFDLPFPYRGVENKRPPARSFHAEDLAAILDRVKTCHLNVIIDANHAGDFGEQLLRIPNTESVLTVCQQNEYTYSAAVDTLDDGAFADPFGAAQGERGSEFTSSVAKALVDNAPDSPDAAPPSAHFLMGQAFEAVKRYDLAYLAGKTTPMLQGRSLRSGCSCGIDEQLSKY